MITMQNSWDTQRFAGEAQSVVRNSSTGEFDNGSMVGINRNRNENTDFGLMMERSISAPPPSGMGFDFEKESFLLGNIGGATRVKPQNRASSDNFDVISNTWKGTDDSKTKSLGLFDNLKGNGSHSHQESLSISDVLLQELPKTSRTQQSASVSFGGQRVSHYGTENTNHVGSLIDRPQSAAPNISANRSGRHAPPGLERDFSSTSTLNMFNSEDVMKIGLRRPASTGVIGQVNTSTSVMETLGLMSASENQQRVNVENNTGPKKSFMDLIQEDFTKSPSPEYTENFDHIRTDHPHQVHSTNTFPHAINSQTNNASSIDNRPDYSYYHNHHQQPKGSYGDIRALSHDMQKASLGVNNSNEVNDNYQQYNKNPHIDSHIGQQTNSNNQMHSQGMSQHSNNPLPPGAGVSIPYPHQVVYNSPPAVHMEVPSVPNNAHISHHNPHSIPQQASFEQQPIYFATQQYNPSPGADIPMQAQVLPSQTSTTPVYMSATPFGYATVQYHTGPLPHQLSNQILHTHNPTFINQAQHSHEFVPSIAVHGNPPGQVTEVNPNGPYVYWQQPSNIAHHGAAPTFTFVNAHGQATTIAVAPVSAPPQPPNPQSPTQTSRATKAKGTTLTRSKTPDEKVASKTKKNCNTGSRRSGIGNTTTSDQGKNSSPNMNGSSLLEDFRCAKNRSWTIADIQGHIVEFCQDQNGSRFIQQRLEVAKLSEKELVMLEVLPSVRRLRNDVFGNYVVQKLLENGSDSMKEDLKNTLQGEMLSLSMQMYGCRVVQKALETLGDEKIPRLLEEFHGNVLTCIHDQNGNHVIQKCVEVLSSKAKRTMSNKDESKANFFSDQIQFIIDNVIENIAQLSCHPYGCRVLQRILEHCVESQKLRTLDEIMKVHRTLLDDQYGNYVIQHVLQYGRVTDRDSILEIVTENGLLNLSRQKYASNVVEKLLKFGTANQRNAVVREMLMKVDKDEEDVEEGTAVVLLMVRDAYANYVVQTSLDVVVEGEERRLLLEELNKNANQLRNFTFAKHIVTKLGH